MRASSRGMLAFFLLFSTLAGWPVWAQKSLADGVDDLASKLAASYGEAKKGRVAILPFRPREGGENLLGTYLADNLTNSLFNAGYRDIVERQMLDRAIKELKLQYTGMIDPESAKKVGKFLHADLVVGGTLSDLLGKVEVTCRMFSVETGAIVAVAKTELLKDDNVKTMMGKTTGSGLDSGPQSEDSAPGEREGSNTQKVERPPAGNYLKSSHGFEFILEGCTPEGTDLHCWFKVTNKRERRELGVWPDYSKLVDQTGNSHKTGFALRSDSGREYIVLKLELSTDIAERFGLHFEGLGGYVTSIKLLAVHANDFNLEWRDVKVK